MKHVDMISSAKISQRVSLCLRALILGGCLVSGSTAFAQDSGLFDRMFGRRAGSNERQAESVLSAFRPLMVQVGRSVVQISNGDDEVAWGAVVRSDGMIVTKRSDLRDNLQVTLPGDRVVSAQIVAESQELDLALLQCSATGLKPVEWSDEAKVPVGTFVFTPSSEDLPLAIGVVSVANRSIARVRVVSKAYLGVRSEFSDDVLRLAEVVDGTPAAKAGLKSGDVLLEVNGVQMDSSFSLQEVLAPLRPDDEISVKVGRGNEVFLFDVTLTTRSSVERGNNWFRRQRDGLLEGDLSQRRGNFSSAFQHDTVLRPEDCGGPIVGLDGKALGINIARARRVASYAIPASDVLAFVDQALSNQLVSQSDGEIMERIDALSDNLTRMERDLELMGRAYELQVQIRDLDRSLTRSTGAQRDELERSKIEAAEMLERIRAELRKSESSASGSR